MGTVVGHKNMVSYLGYSPDNVHLVYDRFITFISHHIKVNLHFQKLFHDV